ncbi:MAG: hypothetical protein HQ453_09710, partial [Actinobacteria bacterium]|nr:hypothetical protein [Actinomycetota bacterium]
MWARQSLWSSSASWSRFSAAPSTGSSPLSPCRSRRSSSCICIGSSTAKRSHSGKDPLPGPAVGSCSVDHRIVVLASGSGTLLQALLDSPIGGSIVAVGSDRGDAAALGRASRAGLPAFEVEPGGFATRGDWDTAFLEAVQACRPDWVVSAGFMRIL